MGGRAGRQGRSGRLGPGGRGGGLPCSWSLVGRGIRCGAAGTSDAPGPGAAEPLSSSPRVRMGSARAGRGAGPCLPLGSLAGVCSQRPCTQAPARLPVSGIPRQFGEGRPHIWASCARPRALLTGVINEHRRPHSSRRSIQNAHPHDHPGEEERRLPRLLGPWRTGWAPHQCPRGCPCPARSRWHPSLLPGARPRAGLYFEGHMVLRVPCLLGHFERVGEKIRNSHMTRSAFLG